MNTKVTSLYWHFKNGPRTSSLPYHRNSMITIYEFYERCCFRYSLETIIDSGVNCPFGEKLRMGLVLYCAKWVTLTGCKKFMDTLANLMIGFCKKSNFSHQFSCKKAKACTNIPAMMTTLELTLKQNDCGCLKSENLFEKKC